MLIFEIRVYFQEDGFSTVHRRKTPWEICADAGPVETPSIKSWSCGNKTKQAIISLNSRGISIYNMYQQQGEILPVSPLAFGVAEKFWSRTSETLCFEGPFRVWDL